MPGETGLAAPASERLSLALREVLKSARQVAQYPGDHPVSQAALERALTFLNELFGSEERLVLTATQTGIFVNGEQAAPGSAAAGTLSRELRRRHIRSIILNRGATAQDIGDLLRVLAQEPVRLREAGGLLRFLGVRPGRRAEFVEVEATRLARVALRPTGPTEVPSAEGFGEGVSRTASSFLLGGKPELEQQERSYLLSLLRDPERLFQALSIHAPQTTEGAEGEESLPEDPLALLLLSETSAAADVLVRGIDGTPLETVDKQAAVMAHVLQRLWRTVRDLSPDEQEALRRQMAEAITKAAPDVRARLFRAPVVAEETETDVLGELAEELTIEELVDAVLPDAQQIQSDTSAGLQRALKRIAPNRRKVMELEPLLKARLAEWELPQELYTNVIGMALAEFEDVSLEEFEALGLLKEPGKRVGEGRQEMAELFESIAPQGRLRHGAEVLSELLAQETQPAFYLRFGNQLVEYLPKMVQLRLLALALKAIITFEQGAKSPDAGRSWERRICEEALDRIRETQLVDAVKQSALQASSDEAAEAVMLLASMGAANADELVHIIMDPSRSDLHTAAAFCLRRVGGDAAIAAALRDVPRSAALRAVSLLLAAGDPDAVRFVTPLLENRDWMVRLDAVEFLGQSGSPVAAYQLEGRLKDKEEIVREAAVDALARLGGRRVPAILGGVAKAAGVADGLRRKAIQGLGMLRTDECVQVLLDILRSRRRLFSGPIVQTKVWAATALGNIPGVAAQFGLQEGAKDPAPEVAALCARLLEERKAPPVRQVPEEQKGV